MKNFASIRNLNLNHFIAAILLTAMLALSGPLHANGGGMGNSDSCGSCHGAQTTTPGPVTATGAIGNTLTLKQGEPLMLRLGPSGGRGFSAAIAADGARVTLTGAALTSAKAQVFSTYYFTHTSNTSGGPYEISYNTRNIPIGTYVIDSVMRAAGSGWQNGAKITLKIETAIGAPGTPTIGTATAGNRQVSVAFNPTGLAATGFTALCNGFAPGTGTASPVIVSTNIDNGQAYTCSVTASNAAGTSAASALSNSVIPNNRPAAPTGVVATRGNSGEVSVSFTPIPPANTGGSAISLYTATCGPLNGTNTASPVTVQSLSNGTPVTCTVTATNTDRGTSVPSAASNPVTPAGPPEAPRGQIALSGNGEARVIFEAPFSNGGAPITSYTATCSTQQGAISAPISGPASPLTVTGLANATPYTCRVTATNAAGTSEASIALSVTPVAPAAAAPGAPTSVTATAGDRQVTVFFAAPGNIGSSAITGYTAACGGQSIPGAATARSLTVTGLANETAYACTVFATNNAGNGPVATASSVRTVAPPVAAPPPSPPGAPTITSVVAGIARLAVNFNAPGNLGSGQISGYSATCTTPQNVTTAPFAGGTTATPIDVTGLSSTTSYTCRVRITTSAGTAESAASSPPATPLAPTAAPTRPGAPTIVSVTRGNAEVRVTFSPGSDGGTPITGYSAICNTLSGATAGVTHGTASPLTVKPLVNGTAYTCKVFASNAMGPGAVSVASNSVIPVATVSAPGAPTIVSVTPGDGQVRVAFTSTSDNSAPITSYAVTCSTQGVIGGMVSGPASAFGSASPRIVLVTDLNGKRLTNGTAYTCTVTATNAGGTTASAPSSSVTPVASARRPDAPTTVMATAGNAQVRIAFTAPSGNGSPITGYGATCYTSFGTGVYYDAGLRLPIVVTGLTNGTAYTCKLTAKNAIGTSAESAASNSVTPR